MQLLAGLERLLARVGKRVLHVEQGTDAVTVEVSSRVRAAPCPDCRRWSDRIHGSYVRYLAERPVVEQRLVLAVQMRRFKCPDLGCARRTFAESVNPLAGRHQRRTRSQACALQALGHALGGEAAARLAAALGLNTSADTVLRQLRRADTRRRRHKPRIVGIDDWAIARGHNYGTIIVDLERREPIEVLVGREATAVTQWLRRNPSIEIVARDRAGAYSEAVNIALPHAQQVSDRWHLLSNLRDNVERMLQRMGSQMREAARSVVVTEPTHGRQGDERGRGWHGGMRLSDDCRSIRLALYDRVMELHTQGRTMKSIAGELAISYQTVRKFVHTGSFPERARKARGHTPLDAHLQYIEGRIAQGFLQSADDLARGAPARLQR